VRVLFLIPLTIEVFATLAAVSRRWLSRLPFRTLPDSVASQVFRFETGVLGDASKHARADLVTFVERKDIALTVLDQHPV
jgi:hypothetical protein